MITYGGSRESKRAKRSTTGDGYRVALLTKKDLEIFVDTYQIREQFSPTLPSPDDPVECTPERIVLYTLAFSSCGVRYPLSAFKVELLKHLGIHFSQLHPLAFMRVVHFELSCVAVAGEPSKDNVSPPCYSFMPTSTNPKEWKNRFIFVAAAMVPESPPSRDPKAPIEDSGRALEKNAPGKGSSAHVEDSVTVEKGDRVPSQGESSSKEAEGSRVSLQTKSLSDDGDDKDLESRFFVKDKAPDISVASVNPTFDVSPLRATSTSIPSQPEDLFPRSLLAPLFAEALPVPYVPKLKITPSTVMGTVRI
ncbi:hypothetical protein Hanom_Chr06g00556921 [Helianthus anomalus]